MVWQYINQIGFLAVLAVLSILVCHRLLVNSQPTSSAKPLEITSVDNGKTYCIRGVPLEWSSDQLQSFLASHNGCHDLVVKSLAPETHGRSQTGTVASRHKTQPPTTLRGRLQPDTDDKILKLDDSFHGLTTLFAPSPEDHQVDIVAISGLGGHAFGSFKERDGQHMWLRDALPYHLLCEGTNRPMARVMTYGYDSAVAESSSFQNLEDLATSFRETLSGLMSSRRARPLILVAHSLGGLIVKQAIITLANSTEEVHQKIIRAIYGVVFFGVPHDGMDISCLIPMVGDGPNRELVGSLSRINSQILSMQQRDFHRALGPEGHTEIFCFYETNESPTAQQDKNGKWRMTGPKAVLVTKSSATHCRPWEDGPEHICAINRSHSNMVKFGQEDDEYERVLGRLQGLAARALGARSRLRDKNTKFLVPYNPNINFINRSTVLETVKERLGFTKSQVTWGSRVSLFGLGGVGKTQIALAFVHWIENEYPDVSVFWVHASNANRFNQAFASFAEEYKIPGYDDPKSNVPMLTRKWLENKKQGRWVMVIDNADDQQLFFPSDGEWSSPPKSDGAKTEDGLARYIPECRHGSILVTTRSKQVGLRLAPGKPPIEIEKMDSNEADQLLRAALGDISVTTAETFRLSSELDYLPLALSQAAALIQANGITVDKYLQLLEESDESLVELLSAPFSAVGRDSETPHAVTAAWIVSFNQIQRHEALAGDVLAFCSLLDRQGIPEKLIAGFCNQMNKEMKQVSTNEITKTLGTLKAFSFMSDAKGNAIDMHRLVQLVTRKWLEKHGRQADYVEQALRTVSDLYPYGEHESRQACQDYLPHANTVLQKRGTGSDAEKLARASLLHNMGGYFRYRGWWKKAEQSTDQSLRLRQQLLGENHQDTLNSMGNLASTYWGQGRWKEAEKLYVQVIETEKRVLGDEHPSTLVSMNNLASTYREQRRWKEAEELDIQVIEARKRVLGDEHPATLTSIANLASVYWSSERWKEAEELGVQVVETRKRVRGDNHPDTLISIANLASTYQRQGRWKEAEELGVQVMETRKRVLGDEHPSTLMSMNNLAHTWKSQGRQIGAIQMMRECLQLRQRYMGLDHPHTKFSASTLEKWEEYSAHEDGSGEAVQLHDRNAQKANQI